MRRFLVATLGGLALAGCTPAITPDAAPDASGPQSIARDLSTADRAACTAAGGRVERRGRLGAELCVHPFADAGKQCTDSVQCRGKCVSLGNSDAAPTAGQCQADDRLFGCYSEIKDGKAAATLCVD